MSKDEGSRMDWQRHRMFQSHLLKKEGTKGRAIFSIVLCASFLCRCTEPGILLDVHGAVSLEELEFHVGVKQGDKFILDTQISAEKYRVAGRDLKANPFEFFLKHEESGDPVWIRALVLGYKGGTQAAYGLMNPPQVFIDGEVLRRKINLKALGEPPLMSAFGNGCFVVWSDQEHKQSWQFTSPTDRDCDGYSPSGSPKDCKDSDSSIHPSAPELCDGKDNNCDGQYASSEQTCYAIGLEGRCLSGTRKCGDEKGKGFLGVCDVESSQVEMSKAYCHLYQRCKDRDSSFCASLGKLQLKELSCTIEKASKGVCQANYRLSPPEDSSQNICRWEILDAGGFSLGLSDGEIEPKDAIWNCTPTLTFKEGPAPESGMVLLMFSSGNVRIVYQVILKTTPGECSSTPMTCS